MTFEATFLIADQVPPADITRSFRLKWWLYVWPHRTAVAPFELTASLGNSGWVIVEEIVVVDPQAKAGAVVANTSAIELRTIPRRLTWEGVRRMCGN
ncbi:hypothetical protein EFL95_07565 [Nocardioides marmorisolisilvae]|uniref:Uncharacterized protein n=1 Tax=Nocardioides marmorisolisilvae TaxID=1542737 RepID=A0A3N0DTE3_9ACTN|nr:hypothetical protein EFL95_07565 [Nocardioides marmorisolisilvae]